IDGVPATTAMHFRNGAVAFTYLGTLLMKFVDEHKVKLDDTIDRWMPKLPEANKVTLKMLANQTSGYPDYETDPAWLAAFIADPFHIWTFEERLKYAFSRPIQFAPGTNWSYAHTNFMILGEILSKIGGKPLGALLSKSSYEAMTGPHLLGFGKKQDNCAPSCGTQTNVYNYGLGVVRSGSWLLQNPLLGDYAAIEGYLPSKKIAIAVAVSFAPEAFD